jgi:hypothetical protein
LSQIEHPENQLPDLPLVHQRVEDEGNVQIFLHGAVPPVCASGTFTNPPSGKDYGAVELPDTISDFGKALEARLGKSILAVRPSIERFGLFNGIDHPC